MLQIISDSSPESNMVFDAIHKNMDDISCELYHSAKSTYTTHTSIGKKV